MTDREVLREWLQDKIAHWPIGTGYERVNIGLDEAAKITDAVLSVVDEETERLRGELVKAWERGRHAERHYASEVQRHAHWSHIGVLAPANPENPYRAALDTSEGDK